jgi:hypothetical protein
MRTNNPSTYLSSEAKASKSAKLKAYVKTDEHRAKISKKAKGKQRRLGAVLTDSTKEQIRNSVREWFANNEVSIETRKKISQANLGKTHTTESIEQMKKSALLRKRYLCPKCNKENLDGGNFSQHMIRKHNWTKERAATFKKS